jgi:hypothetical protein
MTVPSDGWDWSQPTDSPWGNQQYTVPQFDDDGWGHEPKPPKRPKPPKPPKPTYPAPLPLSYTVKPPRTAIINEICRLRRLHGHPIGYLDVGHEARVRANRNNRDSYDELVQMLYEERK